jgi:hypothetical protein
MSSSEKAVCLEALAANNNRGIEAEPYGYFHVPEAKGGTFALANAHNNGVVSDVLAVITGTDYVATHWCNTCVGVFIQVDKDRFFLAHINAW